MKKLMKKWIFLFLLMSFTSFLLQAQGTLLDIQADRMLTLLKFKDNGSTHGQQQDHTYNYSINLSTQLYKRIYLRTGFGSQNLSSLRTFIEWNEVDYWGDFSVKQQYLELLPEYHFGKRLEYTDVFIGIGMGTSIINEAEFKDFYFISGSNPDLPRFEGIIPYFTMVLGVNYFINEHLGLKLAAQYRNTGYTKKENNLPRLGFDQGGFILGISYKFAHQKTISEE